MSYPDAVIACIEYKVFREAFRAILRQRWGKSHDNNTCNGIIPWWLTDHQLTANHSNYLVCDRANTQSVTGQKVAKLQPQIDCNASK